MYSVATEKELKCHGFNTTQMCFAGEYWAGARSSEHSVCVEHRVNITTIHFYLIPYPMMVAPFPYLLITPNFLFLALLSFSLLTSRLALRPDIKCSRLISFPQLFQTLLQ
jgi:hypothetical protein